MTRVTLSARTAIGATLAAVLGLTATLSVASAQPYPPPPRAVIVGPPPPGWVGPHYYWHGRHWHHRRWYHGVWRYY
jgi:hypothetical protein